MGDFVSNLIIRISFLVFILAWVTDANTSNGVFDVNDFGAVADGKTDSSQAFEKAWSEACSTAGKPQILVPKGSYLVGPLMFRGPCQGAVTIQLMGQLLATTDLHAYSHNWIEIQYVNGLTITGGGEINGQGSSAWPQNLCPKKWNCKLLPISLVLGAIDGAMISNISLVDSKLFHMNIFGSKHIEIDSIKIIAPGDSPNTDGIHMGCSSHVTVKNSVIGTGDDCVSIGPNNTDVTVTNVVCGPGHGISVGSLGKNANEGDVIGLTVKNCTLTGTTNGVRIKTWQSSPAATSAFNFTYEDIVMDNVFNPIIIDQKYCPYKVCVEKDPSRVKISEVKFRNIRGTSASAVAINMVCSDAMACEGVELSDINLEYTAANMAPMSTTPTTASCVNVRGKSNGNVKPSSCI